jgi:uncharacterized protein (TIGR03083 family)
MAKADLMDLAKQERGELLALLRELDERQWATESLCPGWTVRDVAVHIVSYDELSKRELVSLLLRGGVRVDSVNRVALHRYAQLDSDGVIDLVARCQEPHGLTAAFGGGIALCDGTIHHQDIRRALNLHRTIDPQQLRSVLDFAQTAPTLPVKKNSRGLRLVATDIDWTSGSSGPEVSGPGEAILMATAGRSQALSDLSGVGLTTLSGRVAPT